MHLVYTCSKMQLVNGSPHLITGQKMRAVDIYSQRVPTNPLTYSD
jgi:hypothetical protein